MYIEELNQSGNCISSHDFICILNILLQQNYCIKKVNSLETEYVFKFEKTKMVLTVIILNETYIQITKFEVCC